MRLILAIALLWPAVAGAQMPWSCDRAPHSWPTVVQLESALSNGDTHAAAWRCNGQPRIDTFRPDAVKDLVSLAIRGELTVTALEAWWTAAPKATDTESAPIKRRLMVDEFGAQPKVLTPVAYRRRENINEPAAYVRIGTIPVGENCEPGGKYGTLMLVDRTKVRMDSSVAPRPTTAYAFCG